MLIGLLSGIFGIGGSIIATPILKILFGFPDLIAIASPLPVTIPTAIGGLVGYWQKKSINTKVATATIIGGLPTTIIGSFMTKVISSKYLMVLTGIFVILVGLRLLNSSKLKNSEVKKDLPILIKAFLIGVLCGIFSGLLAVGGGIILVPAFILILGLSMQEAASTSLLCVAFFAIPGTLVHWGLHHIDWRLVLNLSIGVIPAGYIGAHVGTSINSQKLKTSFSIFLIIFGIYFILKQANIF